VGVSGLELCLSNCSWIEHKELNLYPYDAGTDDGITYLVSPQRKTCLALRACTHEKRSRTLQRIGFSDRLTSRINSGLIQSSVTRFADEAAGTDSTHHVDVPERLEVALLRPIGAGHETLREALLEQAEIVREDLRQPRRRA